MYKTIKYIAIAFTFFLASTVSCTEKKEEVRVKTECEQILNVVTDCMGLHRGAFDYINDCGSASIEVIKQLETCDEILDYIENE